MKPITFVLAAALVLAGCNKQADVKAPVAIGEVLPGTVSDAMLETDQSQAQAPVLALSPSRSAKVDEGNAGPAGDATGDATAALEPVSSATPEVKPSATPAPKPSTF